MNSLQLAALSTTILTSLVSGVGATRSNDLRVGATGRNALNLQRAVLGTIGGNQGPVSFGTKAAPISLYSGTTNGIEAIKNEDVAKKSNINLRQDDECRPASGNSLGCDPEEPSVKLQTTQGLIITPTTSTTSAPVISSTPEPTTTKTEPATSSSTVAATSSSTVAETVAAILSSTLAAILSSTPEPTTTKTEPATSSSTVAATSSSTKAPTTTTTQAATSSTTKAPTTTTTQAATSSTTKAATSTTPSPVGKSLEEAIEASGIIVKTTTPQAATSSTTQAATSSTTQAATSNTPSPVDKAIDPKIANSDTITDATNPPPKEETFFGKNTWFIPVVAVAGTILCCGLIGCAVGECFIKPRRQRREDNARFGVVPHDQRRLDPIDIEGGLRLRAEGRESIHGVALTSTLVNAVDGGGGGFGLDSRVDLEAGARSPRSPDPTARSPFRSNVAQKSPYLGATSK